MIIQDIKQVLFLNEQKTEAKSGTMIIQDIKQGPVFKWTKTEAKSGTMIIQDIKQVLFLNEQTNTEARRGTTIIQYRFWPPFLFIFVLRLLFMQDKYHNIAIIFKNNRDTKIAKLYTV